MSDQNANGQAASAVTHYAIDVQTFEGTLGVLKALPWGQVHGIMAGVSQAVPITIHAPEAPAAHAAPAPEAPNDDTPKEDPTP